MKRGDLSVISNPLRQKCFYHPLLFYLPLNSLLPSSPSPSCHLCLFWLCWLRLKTNEATNMWKDRNLLALSSCVSLLLCCMGHVLHNNMAEAKTAKGAALCYMMVCFMPHFPPIPPAPRLLCLYLFLSFRAVALGQVHLQGVWIEMHWSLAHWKQAYSPYFSFFLCIQ